MVGLVGELHAAKVTKRGIAKVVKSITGDHIAPSTVNNMIARISDASYSCAMEIKEDIAKSASAGFDGMMHIDNGMRMWLTVVQSGGMCYFEASNSRATRLLDGMDYKGIAITDMYPGYKRFDADGLHQYCWAHVLRYALHLFEKDDPTLADAWRSRRRKYWEDLMWLFELGKTVSESGAHSKTQSGLMASWPRYWAGTIPRTMPVWKSTSGWWRGTCMACLRSSSTPGSSRRTTRQRGPSDTMSCFAR